MTLEELSVLHYLNREIDMDRRRLMELEADGSAEADVVWRIIKEKQRRNMVEREKLERWIAEIPDSLTRQVFTLRFVHGQTWLQVAVAVGGGNTEDGVRMLAKRYVRKHN